MLDTDYTAAILPAMTKQINIRMPELTRQQLVDLAAMTGMSTTQLVIMAVDRLHRELLLAPARELVETRER
jgi:hypothetical protein